MDRTRTRHLLVTLGRRGLVVFDRPSQDPASPKYGARLRSEQLPSLAPHLADRMGCGDALLAVTTLAFTTGSPLLPSAYLGSMAAAIEGDQMGNIPIEVAMLAGALEGRAELVATDDRAFSPGTPKRQPMVVT